MSVDTSASALSADHAMREVLLRAYALHAAGRFDEAADMGRAVLAFAPENAHALHLVGEVALRRGDHAAAIDLVTKAVALSPAFAEAHNTLGAALKAAGRLDEAMERYRTAIRLKPGFADAHNNLGELLAAQERYEEALVPLQTALRLNPDHPLALNNLGAALVSLYRPEEAIAVLERATRLKPDFAGAFTNLGNAYRALGQIERVPQALARVVALAPEHQDSHLNYGVSLKEVGDVSGADEAFRRAIALAPDVPAAHHNLGLTLLFAEQWAEGWAEFEWRWQLEHTKRLRERHTLPLWDGEPLAGRRLLIWGEQGIGDIVLFATMLPDLLRMGADVVLEVDGRLVPLLARSFPQVTVIPWGTPPPPCAIQAAIGDLGRIFRADGAAFAGSKPYLVPDPARIAAFKRRYDAIGFGPKIGISWRSSSASRRRKSISLEAFAPLLAALPEAVFVSLQYGDTAAERAEAEARFGIKIVHDDSFDNWNDLDGLAAQIGALDHIVTVSNLNAHFAGTQGVPTHVLVTANALWYWPHRKDTTPWYRSIAVVHVPDPSAPLPWDHVLRGMQVRS